MELNTEYFERRAEEGRQAARQASERHARNRHLDLVKRYVDRVDVLSAKDRREDAR